MDNNITGLDVTKFAAGWLVAAGAGRIVSAIIQNNVDAVRLSHKLEIFAAGVVIAGMTKDATKAYTDAKIDQLAAWVREHQKDSNTPTTETV